MKSYSSVEEYIRTFPKEIQDTLTKFRKLVQKEAPKATETISYGIPTYKLDGNLVHFAAFKSHIGFYPGPAAIANFKEELTGYNLSKGTIQFPLDKELPWDLITKIVRYRVVQNEKNNLAR